MILAALHPPHRRQSDVTDGRVFTSNPSVFYLFSLDGGLELIPAAPDGLALDVWLLQPRAESTNTWLALAWRSLPVRKLNQKWWKTCFPADGVCVCGVC